MKSSTRQLIAFVVAPGLLPLAWACCLYAVRGSGPAAFDVMIGLVLPLSYLTVALLGIPCHLALRWLRHTSLAAYASTGLVLGVVSSLAFVDVMVPDWKEWMARMKADFMQAPLSQLLMWAEWWVFGIAAAVLFWLIARADRVSGFANR